MKNIIISGCPRSGKTTLSYLIKNEWPFYNVVHCDAIRNALVRVLDYEQVRACVHDDTVFPQIVVEYVNELIRNSTYPFIVEWSRLYPSLIKRLEGDNISVVLSLGNISSEELFDMCRRYDIEDDFTYGEDDKKLSEQCKRWVNVNKRIISEEKYADIYVETFYDRKHAFERVISELHTRGVS